MTTEAYGKAYQQGFNRTVRFLLSRGARGDGATESAQAAWAKGWERLAQLRNDSFVITWVNTIALNFHRGTLRRESSFVPLTDVFGQPGINFAAIDTEQILHNCRPGDRALFEHYLSGRTIGEIARENGVTETAIRLRLLRARRAVRSWANCKEQGNSPAGSAGHGPSLENANSWEPEPVV